MWTQPASPQNLCSQLSCFSRATHKWRELENNTGGWSPFLKNGSVHLLSGVEKHPPLSLLLQGQHFDPCHLHGPPPNSKVFSCISFASATEEAFRQLLKVLRSFPSHQLWQPPFLYWAIPYLFGFRSQPQRHLLREAFPFSQSHWALP